MTINRRSISVDNYTIPTRRGWRWQWTDVLYQLTITQYRHLWAEDDNEQTFYISWQLHNTDIYELKMTINRRSISVDNYTIPTSMKTFYISWQLHNTDIYELKMTINRRSISADNYTIPTSMSWRWQWTDVLYQLTITQYRQLWILAKPHYRDAHNYREEEGNYILLMSGTEHFNKKTCTKFHFLDMEVINVRTAGSLSVHH